jgi:hypothetical protein
MVTRREMPHLTMPCFRPRISLFSGLLLTTIIAMGIVIALL